MSRRAEILKMRAMEIEMNQLQMMDEKWIFIYDETNNFHKVSIRDGSFNIGEIGEFVVGGLVLSESSHPIQIDSLRTRMSIPKSVKDIKLKHLGKGRFFELIESKKMQAYLEWLLENSLIVHYFRIDPFYWAITDIIDSILSDDAMEQMLAIHHNLKSDLHECLSQNYSLCLSVLEKYGFPSIDVKDRRNFFNDLIEVVDHYSNTIPDFNYQMLRQILKYGRTCKELPYLDRSEGDIQGMLMEKFGQFYRHRIVLFKNSEHLLDDEGEVKIFLKDDSILSELPEIKYSFGTSDDHAEIQISDIFVGLMGKLFTDLNRMTVDEIDEKIAGLSAIGIQNIFNLDAILTRSNDVSMAFQHHVASLYNRQKFNNLLQVFK